MQNNHRFTAARFALGLALAIGTAAAAQAEGLYIGGSIGSPDYHGSIDGVTDGGTGTGGKLYGGYLFSPNFALEAGAYDIGRVDNATGRANARGPFLDAVGFYPLTDRFSLLGSAGIAQGRWNTTHGNDSSFAWKLGAGLQYDLTSAVGVRAEYERYMYTSAFGDKPSVGQTSLGMNFKF